MSKREKWIAAKAAEIYNNAINKQYLNSLVVIEEGIRLGLENADKIIKDDEYEIDTSDDSVVRLWRNSIVIITFWCGDEGEPTKEQAEKAARAVIEILKEQDDA